MQRLLVVKETFSCQDVFCQPLTQDGCDLGDPSLDSVSPADLSAGFDLLLRFLFRRVENLLRAIYSASERRLGTQLFVCLLAIWSPLLRMRPFGIIIKAAIKGPPL